MLQLIVWSARYDRRTGAPPEFVKRIRKDATGVAAEIRENLRRRYGL